MSDNKQDAQSDLGETVSIPTPFGTVRVAGIVALFLILNLSFFGYIYNENNKRQGEHFEQNLLRQKQFEAMTCKIDIEVFIHEYPRGQIVWSELPNSLYLCLPDFIYSKKLK